MSIHTTVPLSALSIDEQNARKTAVEPSPAFVMNVRTIGIKQPLFVRPNGKGYKVTDGGKRLRALWFIRDGALDVKGALVTSTFPVPVLVEEATDQAARDVSLALNVFRDAMHPVDEFETVSALVDGGDSIENIAKRYGRAVKEVNQALALGALSPTLREAWRAGEISAETAQAFTLLKEHADQDKLFAKLSKSGNVMAWAVRRELKADDREAGRLAAFVGDEAIAAAGLDVTRDLFKPDVAIVDEKDVPKLKALADERLARECERLIADGWSWAIPSPSNVGYVPTDRPKPAPTADEAARAKAIERELEEINESEGRHDFEREERLEAELAEIEERAELRGATPKFRKSHGCMVSIDHDGKLEVTLGVKELPRVAAKAGKALSGAAADAVERAATKSKKKKAKEGGGPISNALNQRLSEQLTAAAADVIRTSPHVALAALVAGMSASDKYVDVQVRGLQIKQSNSRRSQSFVNTFEAMLAAKDADIIEALAGWAAQALDFQEFNAATAPMKRKETAALCNALDSAAMLAAIAKRWDAKDYFAGVSGALRVRAATEALGEDLGRQVAKMKKDEATKWCATNVPPTGWLPPEIRTAHYVAPAPGKSAAAAPAKKAPAKKPAKKKAA